MIKMAEARCYDILRSFKSDSTGLAETVEVRALELADSPSADYKWFQDGYELTSVYGRFRNRVHGIYRNSFSKQRSIFDETERVSLLGGKKA